METGDNGSGKCALMKRVLHCMAEKSNMNYFVSVGNETQLYYEPPCDYSVSINN